MTKSMSYNELMVLQNDIEIQLTKSPAFSFFLSDKIQRFYQRNATRINHFNDKMQKLQQQYIKHDDNGVPIYKGEDFDYLEESYNSHGTAINGEDVRSAYRTEATEFMAITFKVEW